MVKFPRNFRFTMTFIQNFSLLSSVTRERLEVRSSLEKPKFNFKLLKLFPRLLVFCHKNSKQKLIAHSSKIKNDSLLHLDIIIKVTFETSSEKCFFQVIAYLDINQIIILHIHKNHNFQMIYWRNNCSKH